MIWEQGFGLSWLCLIRLVCVGSSVEGFGLWNEYKGLLLLRKQGFGIRV